METLGERMKQYEYKYNHYVADDQYLLIRLDGVSFSNLTSKLIKPFDMRFIQTMVETMESLMKRFNPMTGYCHSDEITLIFDKCNENQHHLYNGRVQKLTSVISSFCAVKFNYYLNKYTGIDDYEQCFDARILSFNNIGEITNHQIWRSILDCERNAISSYAHKYFTTKEVHGKNSKQLKEMLLTVNINWDDIPIYIKHGIYCKKALVTKETSHGICQRNILINKCFKINYCNEINELLVNKHWYTISNITMTDFYINNRHDNVCV
jgi:tRNA(His) 5'-end guanylyltransferase